MSAVLQEEEHHSQVRLANGVHWEPESCWDNIYDAIMDCRVLCYVVGELAGRLVLGHSPTCLDIAHRVHMCQLPAHERPNVPAANT